MRKTSNVLGGDRASISFRHNSRKITSLFFCQFMVVQFIVSSAAHIFLYSSVNEFCSVDISYHSVRQALCFMLPVWVFSFSSNKLLLFQTCLVPHYLTRSRLYFFSKAVLENKLSSVLICRLCQRLRPYLSLTSSCTVFSFKMCFRCGLQKSKRTTFLFS